MERCKTCVAEYALYMGTYVDAHEQDRWQGFFSKYMLSGVLVEHLSVGILVIR